MMNLPKLCVGNRKLAERGPWYLQMRHGLDNPIATGGIHLLHYDVLFPSGHEQRKILGLKSIG